MAAIQCPGCKAFLSIKNPAFCPRCQMPLAPQTRQQHASASSGAGAIRTRYRWTARDWFNVTVLGLIAVGVILIVYRLVVPSDDQIRSRKVSTALLQCQQRIAGLAKYGDGEMPPYAKNYGRNDEFYFAWPSGSFHFKNGFGASLKMSASCIGTVSTGEIKKLTLNGEDIL